MKIFALTHSYAGDGASQMLLSAARHWTQELKWQVDAVDGPDMSGEARAGVAQSGMKAIARANFSDNYDAALINCLKNIQFADFIHPHVPVILWAHEAETILKSQASPAQWRSWFAKVSAVIFQTEWQANLYKKYLSAGIRSAIIPNGIPPVPEQSVKTPSDTFRIITVGKLSPMKAQADLIRAAARLAQRHSLHCELIGDTEHLSRLDKRAQEDLLQNPRLFTLSGYKPRDEALARVARADLFCFPSVSESFGLAPLEAAALGIPVILAALPVYKEIGWTSGENCLMFPPGDGKKLEAAIESMMKDGALRDKIAAGGKKLAASCGMAPFLKRISEFIGDAALEGV